MFTIDQCVMCGHKEVPNQELEIPVNIEGIISVKVQGAKCSNCGEEYFNSNDTQAIRSMERAYKEQAVGA
ncbi:YgiT-type zinc finger protein [Paenibacillus yanchengensis]|uniref:YgiT-type zinc finger protein n=1 Tax=Paenibacillus yanchengensis TaxID=2035833 RepID=A0ABW4YIN1_9BACL